MTLLIVLLGATWWFGCEYLRGRPSTPGGVSLALQLLGPLGAIACSVVGLYLLLAG